MQASRKLMRTNFHSEQKAQKEKRKKDDRLPTSLGFLSPCDLNFSTCNHTHTQIYAFIRYGERERDERGRGKKDSVFIGEKKKYIDAY